MKRLIAAIIFLGYQIISWNTRRITRDNPQLFCLSFDYISNHLACFGNYERPQLIELRDRVFRGCAVSGQVAIDVGANIGTHSLFFANYFKEVIAFEANPIVFAALTLNSAQAQNVICRQIAVSDSCGEATFFINNSNSGNSSLNFHEVNLLEVSREIRVRKICLDDFEELSGREIGFVKIDVEGHEAEVLSGMQRILAANMPLIAFEQSANQISCGSSSSIEVLRKLGYQNFYSIETRRSWISSRLPAVARIPAQFIELLVRGDISKQVKTIRICRLENKKYSMLLASPSRLSLD